MSNIPQPHDKIVKASFENPVLCREFVERMLPEEVKAVVDLNHIHRENVNFLGTELEETACDILFRTTFSGRPGYLYLAVEHQSTPDRTMPLRLWKYVIQIWEAHARQYPDDRTLPLVYPCVFYSGEQTYNHPLDLIELFSTSDRDLARKILYQPFPFIDAKRDAFDPEQHPWFSLLAALFENQRAARNHPDHFTPSEHFIQCFIQLDDRYNLLDDKSPYYGYYERMLTYLTDGGESISYEAFFALMETQLPTEKRSKMESFSEHFTNKGREAGIQAGIEIGTNKGREAGIQIGINQGREEGIEIGTNQGREAGMQAGIEIGTNQGREALLIEMLKKGTDVDFMVEVSGLSREALEQLKTKRRD